jgi:hypothetical protein
MAKKTEKVSIGTTQFTITQLGAVEGRRLYKKLVTSLGPLLRDTFANDKTGGDAETRVIGLVLRGLEDMPLDLFEELCESFSAVTLFKTPAMNMPIPLSTQGQFDDLFAGDYGGLTNWVMTCLKMNFANFLGATPPAPPPVAAEPAPSA